MFKNQTKGMPIMGRNALYKKTNSTLDYTDSQIIQDIILDKFNDVLNYYANRSCKRWISRLHNFDNVHYLGDNPRHSIAVIEKHTSSSSLNISGNYNSVFSKSSEFLKNVLDDTGLAKDHSVTSKKSYLTNRRSQIKTVCSADTYDLILLKKHNVECLKRKLKIQNEILCQACKALEYCQRSKYLVSLEEYLEAQRILLVATISKNLLLNEINKNEISDNIGIANNLLCCGEVKITDIEFKLKDHSICDEIFILVMACRTSVLAKYNDAKRTEVFFEGPFRFTNLSTDFDICINLYSMQLYQEEIYTCLSPKTILSKNRKRLKAVSETPYFNLLGNYNLEMLELLKFHGNGCLSLNLNNCLNSASVHDIFQIKITSSIS